MRLRDINKKEFENFCVKNKQDNFFQSKYYAELKRIEGYHTYFIGLEQDGNILAATMLISKNISIFKKRMFYAPRGFIIDYKNSQLLELFTNLIKEYVKNKKGVYIKINPYLILHDRNFDGTKIQGGTNNTKIVENLKKIGWIEKNINEFSYPIEPNLLYQLKLKGKNNEELFEDFSEDIKEIIKRNELIGISTKKLSKDNYQKFLNIIENSANQSNYININKKNYKAVIDILNKHNMLDITIAELDIDKYLESTINSKKNIHNNPNLEQQINKQIESIKQLQYKYGHKILLGGTLAVAYHGQYLVLVHATIDRFHNFNSLTTLYWNTIKSAKNLGFSIYNFYGIGNILENNDKLLEYKKYNGKVVELIGEFDYVINSFFYKKQLKKEANEHRY